MILGVGRGVAGAPDCVGVVRGRPISGVGDACGTDGVISTSGVGVGVILARGVGETVGEGVGVGVFTFPLRFVLRFVFGIPAPTLKLKFESKPVLTFWFELKLVLMFTFVLLA